MWEFRRNASPRGGNLKWRFFIFSKYLTAIIVAIFLCIGLISSPSYAATDATWSNSSTISYNNKSFAGPLDDSTSAKFNINGAQNVYSTRYSENGKEKIAIIYFSQDNDPTKATSANYQVFDYGNTFTNPSQAKTISINTQPTSDTSSCKIDGGLGWLVCPISNGIAGAVDYLFDLLKGFLVIRPISTNSDTPIYKAWSYMRSFANILFVIGFLILIYSQVTTLGIDNYGIKKLLPRLIVAALLVNLSFVLCAVLVDVSNIAGSSLEGIFMSIRDSLVGPGANTWDVSSWELVIKYVLSGSAIVVGGAIAVTYIHGIIALALPAVVSAFLSVLVAFVIIAARQAIVTILIVISPLAFVAYLLPNTEKLFEKWRSAFSTMLILFPAFAILFGGAQLAGTVIMQNADNGNTVMLGMLVQVVPLFFTPLLVKLSGSTVGKIAGIINDPKRGLVDRTRNWAQERANLANARNNAQNLSPIDTSTRRGRLKKYTPGKRLYQTMDHKKRKLTYDTETYGKAADARWYNSHDYSNITQRALESADRQSIGETMAQKRYEDSKVISPERRDLDTQVRYAKLGLENSQATSEKQWLRNDSQPVKERKLKSFVLKEENEALKAEENATYEIYKAKKYQQTGSFASQSETMKSLIKDLSSSSSSASIEEMRSARAKNVKQVELSQDIEVNQVLRAHAGAVEIDARGAERAYAAAINTFTQDRKQIIANAGTIFRYANVKDDQVVSLINGKAVVGSKLDANGHPITIEPRADIIEAAVSYVSSGGNVKAILDTMEGMDFSVNGNEDYRAAFAENMRSNPNKPKFISMSWLDSIGQGLESWNGGDSIDQMIIDAANAQKMSANVILAQDSSVMERTAKVIQNHSDRLTPGAIEALLQQIDEINTNDQYRGKQGELKASIEDIEKHLRKLNH